MVYSLFKAKSWLLNHNCLICYGDIYYDRNIINKLIKKKGSFVLPSNKNWKKHWSLKYKNPLSDLETFKIDNKKYLKQIGSKAQNYSDISGQFMGLVKINKSFEKLFRIFKKISKKLQKNTIYSFFKSFYSELQMQD